MATKLKGDEPIPAEPEVEEPDEVVEPVAEPGEPEEIEEPEEGDEETVVSFGDDPGEEQSDDSALIRKMREKLREKDSRIKELERVAPAAPEIGEKPTLASCDYDEDRFASEIRAYDKRVTDANAGQEKAKAEEEAASRSWAEARSRYDEKVKEHSFADYEEAQEAVDEALGKFASVILRAANDPVVMVKALGSNPAKLAELAKFTDPFALAAAIARMEAGVKVMRKRPAIDKPLRGTGTVSGGSTEKELEKLEKEADRTGDRTKIIAFKREQKRREEKTA